jgi:hypothetical protein
MGHSTVNIHIIFCRYVIYLIITIKCNVVTIIYDVGTIPIFFFLMITFESMMY